MGHHKSFYTLSDPTIRAFGFPSLFVASDALRFRLIHFAFLKRLPLLFFFFLSLKCVAAGKHLSSHLTPPPPISVPNLLRYKTYFKKDLCTLACLQVSCFFFFFFRLLLSSVDLTSIIFNFFFFFLLDVRSSRTLWPQTPAALAVTTKVP